MYPAEIHVNKASSSDTEAPFSDLNLSISNGTVSIKIYDKGDDFDSIELISRSLMSLGVPCMELDPTIVAAILES